jgi:hypothetical protein
MSDAAASSPPSPTIAVGGKSMPLTDALKSIQLSGSWFWWIAALSLINTASVLFDLKYGMALGLGITQVVDVVFSFDENGEPAQISALARSVHLGIVVLIVATFYALGRLARNYSATAFLVGMSLYALDAIIFVLVGDWIGVGFHAFVLFMLWGGYSILRIARREAPEAFAGAG